MKTIYTKTLLTLCCLSIPLSGRADLKQGIAYYKAHNFPEAQQALQFEAKAGNAEAQFWLGLAYLNNPRKKHWDDWSVGKNWLLKSANNGNPYAMWLLADGKHNFGLFFGGVKDPKNWKKRAIARWQELAKEGDGDAVAMLAKYDKGWIEFIPWLGRYTYTKHIQKAAEMGSNFATKIYYNLFDYNKASKKQKETIKKYLLKAAENNYFPAMYLLGNGDGNHISETDQAFKWTRKCAAGGYTGCIGSMYFNYLNGIEVTKNLEKSYKWALVSDRLGVIGVSISLIAGKGKDLKSKLTPAQKARAKKEADAYLKTHLPDYGATPMNP